MSAAGKTWVLKSDLIKEKEKRKKEKEKGRIGWGKEGRTKEEEKLCTLNTATHELGGSVFQSPYQQLWMVWQLSRR